MQTARRPLTARKRRRLAGTCLRFLTPSQFAQAVTAPLDGAHREDGRGVDGWGEIALTDVQTEGHFHDKWWGESLCV